MMGDRAAEVAKFLVETPPSGDFRRLLSALAERWPDLTRSEFDRAISISKEIITARIAENSAFLPLDGGGSAE